MMNIPKVKIGIVAVSRDCFPESLSVNRRKALVDAYQAKYDAADIYECPVCIVESEIHMVQALEDIKAAGCNALAVYLGNFGPEISETLLAKHFDGPKMFVAAAEETGKDLVQGRGDAYCGMLNASYNLALRNIRAYIPEYPVGTAEECADMIHEFLPIARAVIGLSDLKIISFGPRPLNFLACNAPIKQLYNLGVEIEENSELDLFEAYNKHAGDPRIPDVVKDMEAKPNLNYTVDSWNAFQAKIAEAEAMLENPGEYTAQKMRDMVTALDNAFAALKVNDQPGETTPKENLQAAVDALKGLDENRYTADSWTVFKNALDAAQAVLDKEGASDQEYTDALAALDAAYRGLIEKETPVGPSKPGSGSGSGSGGAVQTGDAASPAGLLAVLAVSGGAVVVLARRKKVR